MRGLFEDSEPEPAAPRGETELTLGSGMLLAVFFGLVLVCGLCFGLGYAVGRHGSPPATLVTQPSSGAATDLQPDSARPKPTATTRTAVASEPQGAAAAGTAPGDSSANPAGGLQPATTAGTLSGPSQVRPAMATAAKPIQPAQPAARVAPALAGAVPFMVQIAAVSNQEDADVLAGALRKRGYAVTLLRDPYDSLIHVRIGPFSGSSEAEKWREKLLSDGYNAIVQQ